MRVLVSRAPRTVCGWDGITDRRMLTGGGGEGKQRKQSDRTTEDDDIMLVCRICLRVAPCTPDTQSNSPRAHNVKPKNKQPKAITK